VVVPPIQTEFPPDGPANASSFVDYPALVRKYFA
jgi:hypothetical protein